MAFHRERIVDYAKNTAKRSRHLSQPISSELAEQFQWMGKRIQSMLSQVTESYIHHNALLANVAWADDAELDTVYAIPVSASAAHDEHGNQEHCRRDPIIIYR